MKKFLQFLSATAVGLSMVVGVAAADTTCNGSISGTGAGSTNTVTCVDNQNNNVTCVNNVIVSNTNSQTSTSGGANNSGNTTGGNSTSGSSTNTNGAVVNVGASCAPVAGSTTTFTTAKSTPKVLGSQVTATPTAGVNAGGGAGVKTSELTIAGLLASFGAIAAGVIVRKRAMQL